MASKVDQHQRQVFFRRQAADMRDHQIVCRRRFQAARRASLRRAGLNSRYRRRAPPREPLR
jgi:hypothetical protein